MRNRLAVSRLFVAAFAALLAGCASTPDIDARRVLAPSGTLRVGVVSPGSPIGMLKDPATGETRGVAFEVGQELARRLGASFEAVTYPRPGAMSDALKAGEIDFMVTNASPARAQEIDFTPALFQTEQGYLAMAGSAVAHVDQVDRAGVRVGVLQGSTSLGVLSGLLKNTRPIQIASLAAAAQELREGRIDVVATNKAILFELQPQVPGSRVLDGRYGLEQISAGIPKGRERGMPYLRTLIEELEREGFIRRAIERAGVKGIYTP